MRFVVGEVWCTKGLTVNVHSPGRSSMKKRATAQSSRVGVKGAVLCIVRERKKKEEENYNVAKENSVYCCFFWCCCCCCSLLLLLLLVKEEEEESSLGEVVEP